MTTVLGEVSERGVTERRVDIGSDDGRVVPAVVWTPADRAATALVLIGHGHTFDKRIGYILSLARRLVRHHGMAAASIDFPEHGDRPHNNDNWWNDATIDATIADWKATLAWCRAQPEIGSDVPLGYWGFSMGTIMGLPFVAAEPSVKVAVLGLMGATGPTRERHERDAKSVTIPLLFLAQRDDALFPLDTALALFDLFGSPDKRLHLNLGAHGAVPADEFDLSEAFLAKYLLA